MSTPPVGSSASVKSRAFSHFYKIQLYKQTLETIRAVDDFQIIDATVLLQLGVLRTSGCLKTH